MATDFNSLMIFFLYSIVVGAGIGVIYDVFRIIRIILPKTKTIIFFEDILFCLTATPVMSILIFNVGSGIVRGFSIIGAIIGFSIYYFTIGKIVYRLSNIIIAFIKKILRLLYHLITAPFVFIGQKTYMLSKKVIRLIKFHNKLKKDINAAKNGFHLN